MLKHIIYTACVSLCLWPLWANGQCRDEQDWNAAWTSCETSPNPNAQRGTNHWIMYDFGYQYPLTNLHIWNANQTGMLTRGLRRVMLDYSDDGQNWTEWGELNVPQASGRSYYSGSRVAELGFIQARYVLLTVIENWGDLSCVSMHEVSFGLTDFPVPRSETLWLYPNPAQESFKLAFESELANTYTLEMLNILGQPIYQRSQRVELGRQEIITDVSGLAPGVYVVRLLDAERQIMGIKKLVVQ
ncbi:MAG: T9SS type A sorting domain-containing protein [Bacteroidota bacterium]